MVYRLHLVRPSGISGYKRYAVLVDRNSRSPHFKPRGVGLFDGVPRTSLSARRGTRSKSVPSARLWVEAAFGRFREDHFALV